MKNGSLRLKNIGIIVKTLSIPKKSLANNSGIINVNNKIIISILVFFISTSYFKYLFHNILARKVAYFLKKLFYNLKQQAR